MNIGIHRRGPIRVALIAVVAAFTTALIPQMAASAPQDHVETTGRVQGSVSEESIRAGVVPSNRGRGKEIRDEHLEGSARAGELVDASTLATSVVDDPTSEDDLEFVFPAAQEPREVKIGRESMIDDGSVVGVRTAVEMSVDDAAANEVDADDLLDGATGYAGVSLAGGWDVYSDNCWTIRMPADGTDDTTNTRQCYEKIGRWTEWCANKRNGTWADGFKCYDDWIYNRWTTVSKADYPWYNVEAFTDFTIRTKPWLGRTSGVSQIKDMEPYGSVARNCRGQVSVGNGFISFNTNVACDDVEGNIYYSSRQFRVDWDGRSRAGTLRLDGLGKYEATSNTAIPRFTDYVYYDIWDITSEYYLERAQIDDGGWVW